MKKHNNKQSKPNTTDNQTKPVPNTDGTGNLNRMAEELNTLARGRLPNNIFQGVLSGYEDEIRQDAMLLALSWYLRHQADPAYRQNYPWHAPRAIAAALRIRKRDWLKALKRNPDACTAAPVEGATTSHHPVMMRPCDWSASTMQTMVKDAIRIAHKTGRISIVNAAVALEVLIEEISAEEIAKRMGFSRSAVYQHLGRVRRVIPNIIDGIELPFLEF